MASAAALADHLTCPICTEIYTDPVSLRCQHTFCQTCLNTALEAGHQHCPVCRDPVRDRNLQINRLARDMADQLRGSQADAGRQEDRCPEHDELLKLFCETDGQLICLVCKEGRGHRGHAVKPVMEAQEDLRREVDASLSSLDADLADIIQRKGRQSNFNRSTRSKQEELRAQISSQFAELQEELQKKKEWAMTRIEREYAPVGLGVFDMLLRQRRERQGLLQAGRDVANPADFLRWWGQSGQAACRETETLVGKCPSPKRHRKPRSSREGAEKPSESLLQYVDFEGMQKNISLNFPPLDLFSSWRNKFWP